VVGQMVGDRWPARASIDKMNHSQSIPSTSIPAASHDLWKGFWCLADPKISLASMASIFLGTCTAAALGPLHLGWLAVTVLGIFAIEVAKNASGKIFDFDSGADLAVSPEDRTPFSGGKRVLVDGLLTRRETIVISLIGYLIGAGAGFWIVAARESGILWIGIIGVLCAYLYHAPPLKLSYRGLGELVVGVCYGPLIALGAFLVQRGQVTADVLLISIPLGLLIAAFLWINEFPDYTADKASGKRTLVVRLGRYRASRVFAAIVALAFAWLAVLLWFRLPPTVVLGFAGLFPATTAARSLWNNPEQTRAIVPAQAQTLLSFALFALGAGIGFLLQ
jgi:1,4-dihydroxy-2-naphthoate octaprenyltransferase